MPGKGGRPGCVHALSITHRFMLECKGCGGLVAKYMATKQAHEAKRKRYKEGDGCASRKCCKGKHKPAKYEQRQERMRAELEAGSRKLVKWPRKVPCARGSY